MRCPPSSSPLVHRHHKAEPERVVLVVDDDPLIRKTLAAILMAQDYRVLTAESGPAARGIGQAEARVDLLVTDFMMPEMDGIELIDLWRTSHPETRFILVSGAVDPQDQARAESDSPVRFLSKPFRLELLVQTVRQVLAPV